MISSDTTIAQLLAEHPELGEVLAGYHPQLRQVRDRLPARLTLGEAARAAGVPLEELLGALGRALAQAAGAERSSGPSSLDTGGKPPPLAGLPPSAEVHLDVRDDIQRGREPFPRIMGAVKALAPGQVLVLRAPFEPLPLYDVLRGRGFAHWTMRRAPDDWSVWFYREAAPAGAAPGPGKTSGPPRQAGERRVTLDVRGLEPPAPMVRVLEELERLRPGECLEVIHERRPVFLYPQLDERGFSHETHEPHSGIVHILIRRRGDGG